MSISEYYRQKIVNDVASWKDTNIILEEYKKIWLTYSILNTIIDKSTKCKIYKKDWKFYRKCIYCEIPKEINEENFCRDPSKKFWFATICKYHGNIKRNNWRTLNRKKYLEQHNEQQKRYNSRNSEKIREYRKNFYQENKDRLNNTRKLNSRKQRALQLKTKLETARNNL